MKILLLLFLSFSTRLAFAEGSFHYVGDCDSTRIQASPDMQRAFRAISAKIGQSINLNSCYRSQKTQNSILQSHGCRPYGNKSCTGSVATRSYHTYGIAGDFHVNVGDAQLCQAMGEVRAELMGGRGGVGGYGSGYAHFDNRTYRCAYNICGKFLGGCFGNRSGGGGGRKGLLSGSGPTSPDEPYTSAKVDDYEKNHTEESGPTLWLHWLLRTLSLGLIK